MEKADRIASMYDVVTFDCYGTLIDWEGGFTDAFVNAGLIDDGGRSRVIDLYHSVEPKIQGEWRPYREVLRQVALQVARELGKEIDDATAAFLPSSLPSWPVFPDTNAALERLASAGLKLGILSNIDRDLFAVTSKQFTVGFDLVVTAEELRSYKPKPAHFTEARERIGDQRWLHAAQSYFHDIVPARQLDIDCAWINRKHETATGSERPDRELENMTGLADWLCA